MWQVSPKIIGVTWSSYDASELDTISGVLAVIRESAGRPSQSGGSGLWPSDFVSR
jgi:hypothetical protein